MKMGFETKIPTILGIFAICVTLSTSSLDATFKSGLEHFSQNIFYELLETRSRDNIIFSPFAAQTCLAMIRMGADGKTAAELDRAMGFHGQSPKTIADNYVALLSQYENSKQVHVTNKVYVMKDYEFQDSFNKSLTEKFFAAAESIDFGQSVKTAEVMNKWVDARTNHLIKEITKRDIFCKDTRLFLLNAIHFKGKWLKPFVASETRKEDFYIDANYFVKVEMMVRRDNYEYAYLDDLKAEAVRLPYKDSDLSMLIFLPSNRTRTGLTDMVEKLKDISLESLTKKMHLTNVTVNLPKFKTEFTIELGNTLRKLNMKHFFSNADFSKLLAPPEPLAISYIEQKASIEVTEMGTEATAATGAFFQLYYSLLSAEFGTSQQFYADHPFHYVILNTENVVLFQGNIIKFN